MGLHCIINNKSFLVRTNTETHTGTLTHVRRCPYTQPAGSVSGDAYLTQRGRPSGRADKDCWVQHRQAGMHKQTDFLKETPALHRDADKPPVDLHAAHHWETQRDLSYKEPKS